MPAPKDPIKNAEFRKLKSEQTKAHFANNPDARKKTSETTKAAMARPEVRDRLPQAIKEGLSRPEVKAKRSASMKKLYAETDLRERVSKATKEAMVEVLARPEFHKSLSDAMQKLYADPEYREKQITAMNTAGQTPEAREAWAKAMSVVHRYRGRSGIEVIVAMFLDSLEIEYEEQKHIGRYYADFYVPSKKLVIECDGEYWHNDVKLPGVKAKDARKDAYLLSCGYSVLRLPEIEIKSKNFVSLLDALS